MIYYKRDENNHLIGFRHNYKHYYYLKNAQEDIIGIMDSDYNVIANYKYDAYGNINLITDNKGLEIIDLSHVAYINPFRYRSYYYDEETKLYYLNSRYYNPLFGRFINADRLLGPGNDLAYNLYLYCGNNPVSRVDEDGNWFFGIVAKGIKAVAKPALKAADKMVEGAGNCIGAVFGAGASVSNTAPIDGPTASAFGVSVSVGGAVNTPSLSVGNSNKPISGYYSQTNNDANIGINLNFGYFKETINVGYDDISISYGIYSNREKTKFNEFKLGASIKQFTFFAQGNYNLANSDGSSTDTYARVDVNAWIPITVFAGGPIVRSVAAALQGRGALVPAY